MTEQEWLNCNEPHLMAMWLGNRLTHRKRGLLMLASCRTHPAEELVELDPALTAAEKYLDGALPANEVVTWADELERQKTHQIEQQDFVKATLARTVQHSLTTQGIDFLSYLYCHNDRHWPHHEEESDRICSRILREVLNPFGAASVDPAWLTSTVVALARGIYEDRAFDRMPILADALQDAGCDSAEVLDHCRGPGPHVRGCWVVDMLLGKS